MLTGPAGSQNPLARLRATNPVTQLGRESRQAADRLRVPTRHLMERTGMRRGALPDFLVIGAMKAGSTMFYEWLITHPLVLPAAKKEVHFFDSYFGQGEQWYRSRMPRDRKRRDAAAAAGRPVLVGEATPNYLFHPLVPRRASTVVPDAKLIVLLRNPVNRAYSHYSTGVRHDWEALSFEEALERESVRLDGQIDALLQDEKHHRNFARYRWSYKAMGHYADLLERWFEYYPRDQFVFVFNEQMDRDADAAFLPVWDFLGLPEHRLPEKSRRVVGRYAPMRPDTRAELIEYFRPHNRRLAELLGVDPGWDV